MVRPDFLAWHGGRRVIVDAKYKNLSTQRPGGADEDNVLRGDVYQMLAYSRHGVVQTMFSPQPPNGASAIILCYPARQTAHCRIRDFDVPVLLFGLPVPTVRGGHLEGPRVRGAI